MSNAVYEMVTNKIVEHLKNGVAPWKKPWFTIAPMNCATGRHYSGINRLLLVGYDDPRFLSYKQAKELGGFIRKGAKSVEVVFVIVGKKEEDPEGIMEMKELRTFGMRYYRVFNIKDVEGIEFPSLDFQKPFSPIEEAEAIAQIYFSDGPTLSHGGQRAYYVPLRDHVQVPEKEKFSSPEEYYSTLFHEMGHSTGHSTRLNRVGISEFDGFGSHQYSFEELVAELTAAFLCGKANIETTLENSAAYLSGWARKLKDNPKWIIQAASQAQKAADYVLFAHKEEERSAA